MVAPAHHADEEEERQGACGVERVGWTTSGAGEEIAVTTGTLSRFRGLV